MRNGADAGLQIHGLILNRADDGRDQLVSPIRAVLGRIQMNFERLRQSSAFHGDIDIGQTAANDRQCRYALSLGNGGRFILACGQRPVRAPLLVLLQQQLRAANHKIIDGRLTAQQSRQVDEDFRFVDFQHIPTAAPVGVCQSDATGAYADDASCTGFQLAFNR